MMKYNPHFRLFLFLGIILFSKIAQAQNADTELLFRYVPTIKQPSSAPEAGWYIGFPALSSFNLDVYNSGFTYKDIVNSENELNVDALFDELRPVNSLSYRLDYQLFQFGFKVKDIYIKLALSERSSTKFDYSENLLKLAWYGNGSPEFMGNSISMGEMAFNSLNYSDVTIGFSMPFMDDFRIGGNFHYLNGIAAVRTKKSDLSIYTNPEYYNIQMDGAFELQTAGIVSSEDEDENAENETNENDFQFITGNHGFSIDFGAEGYVTEKVFATFSVNDLGFINWKDKTRTYNADESFSFSGLPLNNLVSEDNQHEDYLESYLDSLTDELQLNESSGSFKTSLNTKVGFTAGYQITKSHEFGVSATFLRLYSSSVFTPSIYYRLSVKNFAGAFAQASLYDSRHFTGNAGLWLRGGPLMIHASVANIPAIFNPLKSHNFGASVGLNLLFNRKKKEEASTKSFIN